MGLVAALLALPLVGGCEGATPQISDDKVLPDLVLPQSGLQKSGSAKTLLLSADDAATSDAEHEGPAECLAWITVEESYDEVTGAFVYRYSCPEGGDIASSSTVGVDDFMGNGSYTYTLVLRDGTEIVWEYTYVLGADGISQIYDASSNEGETYHGVRTYLANDDVMVDEVWGLLEGEYSLQGVYAPDGRFNGTSIFDDPNTAASPDYTLVHQENVDGSFSQSVDGIFDGWLSQYTYALSADGTVDYAFLSDDLATLATPDFVGAYHYDIDGSGHGAYTQNLDDGSTIDVSDVFDATGVVTESWAFDDAATALAVDQEGVIVYQTDGTGVGTVTFHFDDSESVTCAVSVTAEGSTLDCE
jgi:hypothetical protein